MVKRKHHFEVSRQSRQYNKAEIRKRLADLNKYLSNIGLSLCSNSSIKIKLHDGSTNTENFKIKILNEFSGITDQRKSTLETMFVTDSSYISQRTYHKIRRDLNLKDQLPPINQICDLKKSISYLFELNINRNSCFIKYPLQKVEFVFKKILENLERSINEDIKIENNTFIIKLSGDGKVLTKSSHREINNIVFTIINEENHCKTSRGNYILGSYEIEENTPTEREENLKDLIEPFKNFDKVKINNFDYQIVQKFGADMKFIEECYGLSCANSSYGCIYCEADLKKPWTEGDEKKLYPINRTLKKSLDTLKKNLRNKKGSKNEIKGYASKPLLHIEFNMIVIDSLHMFLRISDKLFLALMNILDQEDEDSSSDDLKKRKNLKVFLDILSNNIKIPKPYYFAESGPEKIKLRSFNGTEREKIFKYFLSEITLENLFPNINRMRGFHKVFVGFWILFGKIKSYQPQKDDLNKLDIQLRAWLFSYIPFCSTLETTLCPYIHIFTYHSKELLELHGNINMYNTQGLERLNSTQTSIYFRNTNKCVEGFNLKTNKLQSTYIRQLVDSKNRLDFYNLNGNMNDLKSSDFDRDNEYINSIESVLNGGH